jgi:serine/threonine protein phosphatase 1
VGVEEIVYILENGTGSGRQPRWMVSHTFGGVIKVLLAFTFERKKEVLQMSEANNNGSEYTITLGNCVLVFVRLRGFPQVKTVRIAEDMNATWSISDIHNTFPNATNVYADEQNEVVASVDGVLFSKDKTELLMYPPGRKQESYTVPDGVVTVSGFRGCKGIREIKLPDSVKEIRTSAFEKCQSLSAISLPNGIEKIGEYAFDGCTGLTRLNIPASVRETPSGLHMCCQLAAIDVDENNECYASIDGVLFNKDKTELLLYPSGKKELLGKINFNDSDTLYVLGDVLDRGPHAVQVLLDMMGRGNVVPLVGNHEYMALTALRQLVQEITEETIAALDNEAFDALNNWIHVYDGKATLYEFRACSPEVRQKIVAYVETFSPYEEINVDGQAYLLVHAGIENFDPQLSMEYYYPHELIYTTPNYSRVYFPDKHLVTGHMPTRNIRGHGRDLIYKANNHIAIDCGAVFGGKLAAYCFETGKATYV